MRTAGPASKHHPTLQSQRSDSLPSDVQRNESFSSEHFKRWNQFKRLFLACVLRWAVTAVLVVGAYLVLWQYSLKEAMVSKKKKEFNTLIIAISIALGLNIASSMKHMVRELRWWMLSWYEWTPKEADCILQSENFSSLFQLGYVTRRHLVRLYVLFWVLVNVASQIAVATLGLTYNINPADNMTVTKPGTVAVPDMSHIQTNKVLSSNSQAISALRYTANNYGLVALAYGYGGLNEIPRPGKLMDTDANLMYCHQNSCQYIFYEATPDDLPYYQNVATNRSISTKGTCKAWRVLEGGDGNQHTIIIGDTNRTEFTIPALNGADQTTFMVNPDRDTGPSWGHVLAFEASETDPWFYSCNITVGPVTNVQDPVQEVGTNVTSLAASAIALQGYGASAIGVSTNSTRHFQFQSYPAESYYGATQGGNTTGMGQLTAAFAVGVVAITAQVNTNVNAPGMLPLKGIKVDISHWVFVHLILGLTVGLQLLLAVIAAVVATSVTVRDHSCVSLAAALQPLLSKLDYRMNCEKRIFERLGDRVRVSYVKGRGGIYYIKVTD
ncbi:hypothetical protein M419DRAFT_99510 [Trichoderma reesei RUT C-30]|uniref:Uncharacterized protein n=1 Tax=Hypocrea jecorina (strain ATCC 56765 / BCRC 32924 / NRRL 11460 / Rut C-30) TaxID=1344414 RepID=A0A024SBR3_HYPJR|nr:hypothetical protein M419DRAFT_99510 [Trichoderma reesei RUT C-30]